MGKHFQVLNGYPCKNVTNYFCIFFRFRTFCLFCFFLKNYLLWLRPPPLVYGPVRNFYGYVNTLVQNIFFELSGSKIYAHVQTCTLGSVFAFGDQTVHTYVQYLNIHLFIIYYRAHCRKLHTPINSKQEGKCETFD